MTKEYYEFLFKLRSSGLMHNTPDFLARRTAAAYFNWENDLRITADFDGMLLASSLSSNGEVGQLSEDYRKNMRNSIISTASILPIIADAEHINVEEAYILTDYYINQADDIKTFVQFNKLMASLFADFQELVAKSKRKSYGMVIDKAINYINQNLYGRLQLSDIAKYTGYSPAYLSDLFYKKTGQHIQEYILDQKTDEVKKLLLYSDRSCTEIANALGYSSLAHMSSSFKARTGTTPKDFRNALQNTYEHRES